MLNNLEEVLSAAMSLSPGDRKELLSRLALAARGGKASARSAPATKEIKERDIWFLAAGRALGDAIGGGAVGDMRPESLMRHTSIANGWAAVEVFMSVSGLGDLPLMERQAMYQLLARILVAHAKGIAEHTGAPLSPRLVLGMAGNIGAMFEASFPGYLAAGLARVVANRMQGRDFREAKKELAS